MLNFLTIGWLGILCRSRQNQLFFGKIQKLTVFILNHVKEEGNSMTTKFFISGRKKS